MRSYGAQAGGICLLIVLWVFTGSAIASPRQEQLATRVDDVIVALKHGTLTVTAVGMGRTPSGMNRAARLVYRGAGRTVNKEGLLEYNLVFNGVPGCSGFKLKPVRAKLKERNLPPGVKGVRVFGEFNQLDGTPPEVQPKPKRSLNPFRKKQKDTSAEETAGSIAEPTATPH